jgi:hypothetical protein
VKKFIGLVLLLLVVAAAAAAMGTLIPANASIVNDIGYKSMCPFAPWSTLILLAGGGVLWVIRQYILTRA